MNRKPTVAVCIPTYNQAAYLHLAVRSACTQTYGDIETWIADDASTDDTPAVIASLTEEFPNIRSYRQPTNCGIADNNNWLLAQPRTDYIVRLDSDDILEPSYVERLVYFLEQYPAAGYAHVATHDIDQHGAIIRKRHLARATGFIDGDKALRESLTGYRVAANIVMFRREALEKVHFYRNRPEFVEDYDLSVSIADAGFGNVYVDEILAKYRIWADTGNKRLKRKHLQLAGYKRIYEDNLAPAYSRRGWDTKAVTQQQQRMAREHATYCYSNLFDSADREKLVPLLIALGGSPGLRVKLLALKLGLRPVIDLEERAVWAAKDAAKALLASVRKVQQRSAH